MATGEMAYLGMVVVAMVAFALSVAYAASTAPKH
jgi:ABC-type phosphate/phosphonate transport system permease subunit